MSTSTTLPIDMGKGLAIDLTDDDGRWKLTFNKPAPALDAIEVQAIGSNGQCHPMKLFPGDDPRSIYASGPTEKAYRIRVVVSHGDHSHKRDLRLPGTADYPLTTGSHGGTLISMGHDSFIELLPVADDRWKISFLDKATPANVPPTVDVKAEAIAAPTADDQVRDLAVLPGDDQHSLFLEGKVADAAYLRLAVMMGDHYHTRCVPVTRP